MSTYGVAGSRRAAGESPSDGDASGAAEDARKPKSIASTDEAFHEIRRVRSTGHVGDSIEGLTASDLFDETKTAKANKSLLMSYEVSSSSIPQPQCQVS